MKKIYILGIAALAACGGSSAKPTFTKPAGTVAVNFTVDDTANKVFAAGDLQWKGSMNWDSLTNKVIKDPAWAGPFAKLYDDGPWTNGGHEPDGATAGDNKWGVAVFITPPASGTGDVYEYGLIDNVYETQFGNGWIWVGSNGTFTVAPNATADIKADGINLTKFGTTDIQFIVDKNALATSGGPWDTSKVTIKGSGWAWSEVTLVDDGTKGDATAADGKFTYQLSQYVGAGKKFPHTGLANTGDKPEFIVVFNGKEYKDTSGNANTAGVTAGVKAATATAFTTVTVALAANKNTYITVP
jgi:hypothetical protein